jgi:hypothetical protein
MFWLPGNGLLGLMEGVDRLLGKGILLEPGGRVLELLDRGRMLLELVERGVMLEELVDKGRALEEGVGAKGKGEAPPVFAVPKRPRRFMRARLGKAARIALAWGLFIIAELLKRAAMFGLAAALDKRGSVFGKVLAVGDWAAGGGGGWKAGGGGVKAGDRGGVSGSSLDAGELPVSGYDPVLVLQTSNKPSLISSEKRLFFAHSPTTRLMLSWSALGDMKAFSRVDTIFLEKRGVKLSFSPNFILAFLHIESMM